MIIEINSDLIDYNSIKELTPSKIFIRNYCNRYIERKYGVEKFIFDYKRDLYKFVINPEYLEIINKYLLQRKLRKLQLKEITKRSKI